MYDFLMIAKEFGVFIAIIAVVLILLFFVLKWLYKLNSKIERHSTILEQMAKDISNVHDGCHIPTGAIKSLEDKVFTLQLQDESMAGELKKIEEHLKKLDQNDQKLESGINMIINHFAIEGMKK